MPRHISRHKDKSIDPTGILEARANEREEEVEMSDAKRLDKWKIYHAELDRAGEKDPYSGVKILAIARRLLKERDEALAEVNRLREGIRGVIDTEYGRLNFDRQLEILLGDK